MRYSLALRLSYSPFDNLPSAEEDCGASARSFCLPQPRVALTPGFLLFRCRSRSFHLPRMQERPGGEFLTLFAPSPPPSHARASRGWTFTVFRPILASTPRGDRLTDWCINFDDYCMTIVWLLYDFCMTAWMTVVQLFSDKVRQLNVGNQGDFKLTALQICWLAARLLMT